MIDYKKYELMKECMAETFEVYKCTLDVADYVPESHLDKTFAWIYKNMKKKQRQIDKENRKYQRTLKRLIRKGKVIKTTSEENVLLDFVELEEDCAPEESDAPKENDVPKENEKKEDKENV